MYIENIKLHHFRNYKEEEIELTDGINVFFGDNAQGKTNILEAIFLCAMGKSFRTKKEKEMIQLEEENASIEIKFQKSDREGKIRVNIEEKKNFILNDIKIKKVSEILGNINIVMFHPDDIEILKEGPAARRRFLDMMIGQLKPNYVYCLNQYLKVLEQRNIYIRQIKFENKSKELLEIWDEKLAEYGIKIQEYRKQYINRITEKINNIHSNITDNKEKISIIYQSQCNQKEEYIKKLKEVQKTDIIKGYTTLGVHRDDFIVEINNNPVNIYGSQGQHRTAILSLKLSELLVVYDEIGEYPILLLDDFMSELDEKRRKSFLEYIKNTQVLITCTDKIELENHIYKMYQVKQGKVEKIK